VLVDLLALLLLVGACYALFFARVGASYGLAEARKLQQRFSDPANDALGCSFAAFTLGSGLIICGVVQCYDRDVGAHARDLAIWTSIGMVLMLLSLLVGDYLLLRRVHNLTSLMENNMAVAALESANFLACGLLVYGVIAGDTGEDFGASLLISVIFWSLAQALLMCSVLLFRLVGRGYNTHKLISNGNLAAGLSSGLALFAVAWVESSALLKYGSIALFVPTVAAGVVVLVALRFFFDRAVLIGRKLDEEVCADGNWGAALVEGCLYVSTALVLNLLMHVEGDFDVCEA